MLHVQHGDAFRHQVPQMRVIPGSRRVSFDDKLVWLLFELWLYVGRWCDECRVHQRRLARRGKQTSRESGMTNSGGAHSTFGGVLAPGTQHPAVQLADHVAGVPCPWPTRQPSQHDIAATARRLVGRWRRPWTNPAEPR